MSQKQSSHDATRRILIEPTSSQATQLAADMFGTIVCDAVDKRGICHVALAGGTTPHGLYQLLAKSGNIDLLPWDLVEVFLGDERDVPQDHVESNFGMIQRTLLDHVPINLSRVHPMGADADDIAQAAADYERAIRDTVPAGDDGIPQFDLILLGMGGDGHTASLFPGSEALDVSDRLVVSCFVQVLGRSRMTLTFPLINAARNIIQLVTGGDKAEAIADLLSGAEDDKARLPVARIKPVAGKLLTILDEPAARLADLKKD